MTNFTYGLGQRVKLLTSDETGTIRSRSESLTSEPQYLVLYKAGDGRQVSDWWGQSDIEDADTVTAATDAENDNAAKEKPVYDFEKMKFKLIEAKAGKFDEAFCWGETPQGGLFWLRHHDNRTIPHDILDDMIAQYEAQQTAEEQSETDKEFKLEEGKYYRSRAGIVYGPMELDEDEDEDAYPYDCNGLSWTKHGLSYRDTITSEDLIEEVTVASTGNKAAA